VLLASLCLFDFHVESLKLSDGSVTDPTGLRIRHHVCSLLEDGHEEGHEGGSINRVVDEPGHVVDDDGSLTNGSVGSVSQSLDQERSDHGQGRRLDGLHKGDTGQLVHDLGSLFWVGDGSENIGSQVFNISVSNHIAHSRHCSLGSFTDFLLQINDTSGNLRNDFGKRKSKLFRGMIPKPSNRS